MKTKATRPPKSIEQWRNRIVSSGLQRASAFTPNPLNWRAHPESQKSAMRGSLDTLGWIQQVVVNKTTGHLIDGHERVEEALANGDAEVPFVLIELTEAEERQALATLDPLAAMATTDNEKLNAVLADMEVENEALAVLIAQMGAEAALYQQAEADLGKDSMSKTLTDAGTKMIKVGIYTSDVSTFERAMLATGEPNRAKALMMICEAYLEER